MDWLRGLGKLIRGEARPPTTDAGATMLPRVSVVARLAPDGTVALAAFPDQVGAGRFLVEAYGRRAGGTRRSATPLMIDDVLHVYERLNNHDRPGEFWTACPVEIMPDSDRPLPDEVWSPLFDATALGADDNEVAWCLLDDLPWWEGDEVHQRSSPAGTRPAPLPVAIKQVYIAAEWFAETGLECVVFDEVAAAKRFTIEYHNNEDDGRAATVDFRAAFDGLNRSEDGTAFSLCTIRLGQARLMPILNGGERARAAGIGRGFCDLPDTRLGRALALDE